MAFGDYHPCDHCGAQKTFYDADMDFGHEADGTLVYGGYTEGPYRVGGFRAYALCRTCAETYEIVIVAKAIEAGTAKTEGLGPKDESAVAEGHSPDAQPLYPASAIESAQIAARNEALEGKAALEEYYEMSLKLLRRARVLITHPSKVGDDIDAFVGRAPLTPLQQESEG